MALAPARFFGVELGVGIGEKFFNALAVAVVDGDTDAGGELRALRVAGHDSADTVGDTLGFIVQSLRQNESEFVAAVTRGSVDGAAVNAQDVRESIERMAADEVPVGIIDFLQAIEIEQENGERPAVAIGALGFRFEDIEETAIVGKTGERVADGEMTNLLEEAGIVEESAAESDGVTGDGECLRENKGGIEQPLGL